MTTIETFRVRFPEFRGVGDEFIQSYIDAVSLELDSDVWGTLLTEGTIYLSADKMSRTPFGQKNAMVDKKTNSTIYGVEFDRLTKIVTSGYRVTGGVAAVGGTGCGC